MPEDFLFYEPLTLIDNVISRRMIFFVLILINKGHFYAEFV